MTARALPLRILYTINGSPQYILAKSYTPYPVDIIATNNDTRHPHAPVLTYASVALKFCLQTVCRSSPELIQDNTRDFTVYVLDPLESNSAPAPMHISDSAQGRDTSSDTTPGLAVALGLMSLGLNSEDESVKAVGTIKTGGMESLEVVFALRETVSKTYPAWNAPNLSHSISQFVNLMSHPAAPPNAVASTSSTTFVSTSTTSYPPSTSAQPQKPQRAASRAEPKSRARTKKPVPATGSDKLLDAPEVYIGPQKKKGRPKTAKVDSKGKAKEIIVLDHDHHPSHQIPGPSTSSGIYGDGSRSTSMPSHGAQTLPQALLPQVKSEPQEDPGAQQLAQFLSSGGPGTAAFLATLSSIDAQSEAQNPALLAALKELIAKHTAPPQPEVPQQPAPMAHNPTANGFYHDDEIELLDKENVNPGIFTKKRRDIEAKLQAATGGHPPHSHSAPPSRHPSMTLKTRSNASSPPQPLSRSNSITNGPRKRTLSDFMEERDNNRNREKPGKERERSERRDSSRGFLQPKVPADAFRHYRFLDSELPHSDNPLSYYRTPLEAWTSPVRSKEDNPDPYLADSETRGRETSVMRSPTRMPLKAAASSPIRGNNVDSSLSKKKYIVPAWARTNTATQPRLSEEAQQALKDAEERKQSERRENRRKSCSVQERARRKKELSMQAAGPSASASNSSSTSASSSSTVVPLRPSSNNVPPLLPSMRPLVAAANISPLAALFASPRSRRSPSPNGRFTLPQTPTRPRKSAPLNSGGFGDSLFTPVSKGGSIFGSAVSSRTPLFTPETGYGPSGSPLNRKKMRPTPQTPLSSPHKRRLFDVRSTSSSDPRDLEEVEKTVDADLEKELDAAFEDLDGPPSSLPVASSDTEGEDGELEPSANEIDVSMMPSSSQETAASNTEDEDGEPRRPQKEIWEGLPPSSPPPPSSPQLLSEQPSDTDMEDLELPVATSDMDTDFTDIENAFSDGGFLGSEDELAKMAGHDFSKIFAMDVPGSDQGASLMPMMHSEDMFDQYTNLNNQSDGPSFLGQGMGGFQADGQQNSDQTITGLSLGDLDFSSFWDNTFNPLLEANLIGANGGVGMGVGDAGGPAGGGGGGVDGGQAFDFGNGISQGGLGEVDLEGLGRDMTALLSGCVM
ncbi:hypothetical protein DFP72DRAFT_960214 [Ephemerocybe angulata]|uniref:Ams2/SPT21 N-terminal domain-containing protein n=1 Tax=Ephemerocybe angulata TaxID=980116 RepID=A0A8H6M9N8_9AGAR|nr:hypothetical protein DFP72DRAFT_960214 [Tulosesus angulatus]